MSPLRSSRARKAAQLVETRSGHREQVLATLLRICRQLERLHPAGPARSACRGVSREIAELMAPNRRTKGRN